MSAEGEAPNRKHLAREKVHGGITSWQPRKRLQRRKRNTNRLRDDTSQEPKDFHKKPSRRSTSWKAFCDWSLVARRRSSVLGKNFGPNYSRCDCLVSHSLFVLSRLGRQTRRRVIEVTDQTLPGGQYSDVVPPQRLLVLGPVRRSRLREN